MKIRENRLEILLFVLLLLVWRIGFFSLGVQQINLSGDEAIRALQAVGISRPADSFFVQIQQYPRGLLGHYPLLFMAQPYLFPLESYLSFPVHAWLPPSTFAARVIPMCMGLLTGWMGLLLVNRALRPEWDAKGSAPGRFSRYGTLSMVVFPSAYLLILQCVYLLPSYQALMMFGMLALWLAEKNRDASWKNPLYAFAAGLAGALATSNSLLALPLMGGAAVMVSLGGNWRKALTGTVSCVLGISAGLLPFFLARVLYPGAHGAVTGLVSWREALVRLFDSAISFTLPMVLGIRSPLLPGWHTTVGVIPQQLLPFFGYLWIVFILTALACFLFIFFRRMVRRKWPELSIWEVMTGLSVIYLLLAVLSSRFSAWEFRYLMPVALFFPLILARLISVSSGIRRHILTGAAWLIVAINTGTSLALAASWLDEKFDGAFTDTRPAIEWLKHNGFKYCYSSYMDVYTINYFADMQILCAQPYNERFPVWPYPYAEVVDNADKVAFVLGPGKRFSQDRLEHELRVSGVAYQKATAGPWQIYYDFTAPALQSGRRIDPRLVRITAGNHPSDARTLADGILTHEWRTHEAQKEGMWIELELPERISLKRLKFYYNKYPHDHARSLNIFVRRPDGTWDKAVSGMRWQLMPFDFVNNHPVYQNQVQSIEISGIETDAVRIEIDEPNQGRDWTIGEIEVYGEE